MAERTASVQRKTKETEVSVVLVLGGAGKSRLETSIGFLDHMLDLFATHGRFDLEVRARGDLQVDQHHTVEDVGICLGQAFKEALGDRRGIGRYGQQAVPMDEALASVVVDLSNRPYLVYRVPELAERVGDFETQLVREFFYAFAQNAGATLHVNVLYGENSHHILEAVFKAWAHAMRKACRLEPGMGEVPSTKGVL
ncbi:MAG: imidazoleglycerol-phosphate dehydratase HisB [Deltaproteobacteria bacterium]|nr:imidazoleglycerol-phosphate dehydratase HisB [Deltaproteobacteria bacterium]MBW2071201.1 imidazoleglycerol-phosphate dehydratase HisB [Deltaproteobacteria bacterium]